MYFMGTNLSLKIQEQTTIDIHVYMRNSLRYVDRLLTFSVNSNNFEISSLIWLYMSVYSQASSSLCCYHDNTMAPPTQAQISPSTQHTPVQLSHRTSLPSVSWPPWGGEGGELPSLALKAHPSSPPPPPVPRWGRLPGDQAQEGSGSLV